MNIHRPIKKRREVESSLLDYEIHYSNGSSSGLYSLRLCMAALFSSSEEVGDLAVWAKVTS